MKSIIALLAFVACASAGLLGPPVLHDVHHHHHHAVLAAPVVHKSIYAVPPLPIALAKPVVYHEPVVKVVHEPVVKVLHAPAPIVKHVAYAGPYAYDHHHHHHGFLF